MTSDAWRSFIFVSLSALLLYLYLKNTLKKQYVILIIGLLIIGDMLELGNESLFEHQKICDLILKYNFNDTFLIGKEFQKTKNNFKKFKNINDAKNWILKNPIENSSILLKASRGIKLEDLYSIL